MADWINRYLGLATYVSGWSKDPSTQVGAVIFRDDGSVISMGYNGFPRGCSDDAERLLDRDTKLALTVHAEENALLSAGRNGTPLTGAHIAVTHHPCVKCAARLAQAGIKHVWYTRQPAFEERWTDDLVRASMLLNELGVTIRAV